MPQTWSRLVVSGLLSSVTTLDSIAQRVSEGQAAFRRLRLEYERVRDALPKVRYAKDMLMHNYLFNCGHDRVWMQQESVGTMLF